MDCRSESEGLALNDWPTWLGTPLQALAALPLLGIFGLMLRTWIANRKLDLETRVLDATTDTEARKILLSEVLSLREALVKQSERHRAEIGEVEDRSNTRAHEAEGRYKARAEEAEARHAECVESRDSIREELRVKVDALRDLVSGLRRIITQASALHAIEISENLSEDVKAAAERVDRIFREGRYSHGNSS